MASGIPAFEMVFSVNSMRTSFNVSPILVSLPYLFGSSNLPHQHEHGIVEFVDHALLQWNNRIIRYVNLLRTHLSAAFCDVTQADAELFLEHPRPRFRIERMHLERCHADEKTWPPKLLHLLVLA